EWVHFIEGMPDTLTTGQLAQLDGAYHFTGTPNGEIAMRWYPLAVRSGYTVANEAIAEFLEKIGRRKLIMPTYDALVQTQDGLELAKAVFAKAKPGYHPITTGSVQKVIDEARPTAASAKPAEAADASGAADAAPAEGGTPAAGDATAPAPEQAPDAGGPEVACPWQRPSPRSAGPGIAARAAPVRWRAGPGAGPCPGAARHDRGGHRRGRDRR